MIFQLILHTFDIRFFQTCFLALLFQRVIVNSVENKWIIGVVLKSKQDFTSIERT